MNPLNATQKHYLAQMAETMDGIVGVDAPDMIRDFDALKKAGYVESRGMRGGVRFFRITEQGRAQVGKLAAQAPA